jgi:hypothetical protein
MPGNGVDEDCNGVDAIAGVQTSTASTRVRLTTLCHSRGHPGNGKDANLLRYRLELTRLTTTSTVIGVDLRVERSTGG